MSTPDLLSPGLHPRQRRSIRALRAVTVLLVALVLCWPAFFNGFPLLYPDTISYLADGHRILSALLAHSTAGLGYMRSPLYSLAIVALHWNRTLWPVLALHALLTAWVLWLAVRATLPKLPVLSYTALAAFLCFFTGLPWVVCWLIPDILGPLLYLALFLLAFARDTLSRRETIALSALVVWAADSHLTHILLALALALFLLLRQRLSPGRLRSPGAPITFIAILIAFAFTLQLGLNRLLTGSASLAANPPPFLAARLLADGPARQLLQQRCGRDLHLALCSFAGRLPSDADDFLWSPTGIARSASPEQLSRLRREEIPLALATLHAFPARQLRLSLSNFAAQLTTFDIEGFGNNPWAASGLAELQPASAAAYRRSLQARDALPTDRFSDLQHWTVLISALLLAATLPLCWRRGHHRLLALALMVVSAILLNALLTGVLSAVDSRYQLRVIWLLPFLAGLTLVRLAAGPRPASHTPA